MNRCPHGADAGAYVLDALEPAEADAFERHLPGCEACRREVEELRAAAQSLPLAAEQLVPPPELKQRLMAVVRDEAAVLSAAGAQADRVPEPAASADESRHDVPVERAGARSADRRDRDRRPAWWRRQLPALRPLAAAGLAAALLAIGIGAGVLLGGDGGATKTRTLAADVSLARADARVVVAGDHARLVVEGMPAPPDGKVYQVWTQRPDAAPQPTDALFRTTADGRGSVDVPGSVTGVDRVLVTAEPDGGSAAPTASPVVVASLS